MKKILILGYYYRQNWGDDVFEYVFRHHIFKDITKYELIIKNLEELNSNVEVYKTVDIVILGGGDIINTFFFNDDKLLLFKQYFYQKPIYFVGVGVTYPDLIHFMDIGDYFFIRNESDALLLKERYGDIYVKAIPDIAFNLVNENDLVRFTRVEGPIKKIGITLPAPWLSSTPQESNKFINDICQLAITLSEQYDVYFIPFDTSKNEVNSDIKMIQKIQNKMYSHNISNIFYVIPPMTNNEKFTPINNQEMISYFKNMDVIICGRFHATILSIITQTPFICVYGSKKLNNLKKDMPGMFNYFIELQTNENGEPISFPIDMITNKLVDIQLNYVDIIGELRTFSSGMRDKTVLFNDKLLELIDNNNILTTFRYSPPQYIIESSKDILIKTTIHHVLKNISNKISINDISSVLRGKSLISIFKKKRFANLNVIKNSLIEDMLWYITGDPYAPYYYGLNDNILDMNLIEQLRWVLDDYYKNYSYKVPSTSNNITLINKNFQRLHRSGWQYIVNNIVVQLNKEDIIHEPLIIDTYVDKTFHWNKQFYNKKDIIPYNKVWLGFIHHTYSNYNNDYHCGELFKNELFIQSLQHCKGLIVMTDYLNRQITMSLKKLNIQHVKVYTIVHPTETTDVTFKWDNFMKNEKKQVIQIGNWLRDVFGIYKVVLPESSIIQEKSILKNKNSESYFPPECLLDHLHTSLTEFNVPHVNDFDKKRSVDICRNAFGNMHVKGLYNYIVEMEESVNVIEFLNNNEYDDLLSKNIVFLNLVDASACNTLIECIVRNTPIIINPIPAVVEILGESYPLYYRNYYEVSKILNDINLIQQGYYYLLNMPKTQFKIDTFIQGLKTIILS